MQPVDDSLLDQGIFAKVENGGIGMWSPTRFGDAACVAAWTDNKHRYGDLANEIAECGEGSRVHAITTAAIKLTDLLLVQGINRVIWGGDNCSVSVTAQKIISELAAGNLLGNAQGNGKTQKMLSDIVDNRHCEIFTEKAFDGAKSLQKRVNKTIVGGSEINRAALAQHIGRQHKLAGAFIDLLHSKACGLSQKEVRGALCHRLGVQIGRDNGCCPNCQRHGNGSFDSFNAHADMCRKSEEGGVNHAANQHSDLVFNLAKQLAWLPQCRVMTGNINISQHFDVRHRQDLDAELLSKLDGQCSDLLVAPTGGPVMLIDICVTSVLAKSNASVCGGTGACAAHYEKTHKDKKHAYYMDDEKHLTSMGFDSMGGYSENAVRVLRSLFSRDSTITWKNDQDRLWLQKRTVAVISAIIHKWAGIRRDRLLFSQRRNPGEGPS